MDLLTWRPSCTGVLGALAIFVVHDRAPHVARVMTTTHEDVTQQIVDGVATHAFSAWSLIHPRQCPASIRELEPYQPDLVDVWDRELRLECVAGTVVVTSAGPDGRFGTPDDIRSESAED